jgi:hypothetical protein
VDQDYISHEEEFDRGPVRNRRFVCGYGPRRPHPRLGAPSCCVSVPISTHNWPNWTAARRHRCRSSASERVDSSSDADIIVTGRALSLTTQVTGQTVTTVDDSTFRNTPATTIADIVKLSPGVAVTQGNGPRDVSVSVRGSNARNGFGARNIQVFEDDFPVTQPDGLARFDLTDPHAYGAVDVVRGPSSARYGNYALGGAVNFRTRRGRDIDGVEAGADAGGDGYANVYATIGHAGPKYEYAVFGSFVRADGSTGHTGYETGTINAYGTFALGDHDRVAAKMIYNEGEFRLSTRLSYNQYLANPYQQGCEAAATAAPGCGTISVFVNGINGPRIAQTADEGDLARNDRRTIIGTRYEHDFGPNTTWRTQATFDSRVVNQPTSATPFKGTLDSYNITSDITDHGSLLGMPATSFVGIFYNYLDNQSFSFNKTPAGRDGFGAPTQTVFGDIRNMGVRAREELQLTPRLQLIAGVGAERSIVEMRQTAYAYPVGANPSLSLIPANAIFRTSRPRRRCSGRPSTRCGSMPGRYGLRGTAIGQSVRHPGGRVRQQYRPESRSGTPGRSWRRVCAWQHAEGRSDRLLRMVHQRAGQPVGRHQPARLYLERPALDPSRGRGRLSWRPFPGCCRARSSRGATAITTNIIPSSASG